MSSTRNRVIYAGTTVLASDSPSWNNQTGACSLKLLNRVQSSSISIETPISRAKQIGSSQFSYQRYLTYPKITTDLEYLLTDNSNELILHLITNGQISPFYDLADSKKDINLFFVLSDVSEIDFTDLGSLSGYDVFGIGNAFLTNYSVDAAVGQLPKAKVQFDCLNMMFQNYTGCNISGSSVINGTQIPAIDLTGGYKSTGVYLLTPLNFNSTNYLSNQDVRPSALRPGDLELELQQPLLGGIRYSGTVKANINSFSLDIPLQRKDLVGFGSNYPFDKKLIFPIVGSLSFNGIFDSGVTGSFYELFDKDYKYDFDFLFKNCDGDNKLKLGISNAILESESFSLSIGENMSFSSSFSFEISQNQGFTISGAAEYITGDLIPSINNQTLALL